MARRLTKDRSTAQENKRVLEALIDGIEDFQKEVQQNVGALLYQNFAQMEILAGLTRLNDLAVDLDRARRKLQYLELPRWRRWITREPR